MLSHPGTARVNRPVQSEADNGASAVANDAVNVKSNVTMLKTFYDLAGAGPDHYILNLSWDNPDRATPLKNLELPHHVKSPPGAVNILSVRFNVVRLQQRAHRGGVIRCL
jgi:hypothetical protein